MLTLLIAAGLAAAEKPPSFSQAIRCSALLDAVWPGEADAVRKQRLLSASTWWSGVAREVGPTSGGTQRQRVMLSMDASDRAGTEVNSPDAAVREHALKEAEACADRAAKG